MVDSYVETVWFAVKRLDLNDTDISDVISFNLKETDKVLDVTQIVRSKLDLNNSDLIFRLRNAQGSIIPLNGKIAHSPNSNSRPLTLEVVRRFQSVEPKPNSLELAHYADSLNRKLLDIQERILKVELNMENMHEKRKDKIHQEVSKLENTINFLKKRMEEAETIEWKGMFVKNPLW